MMHSLRARLILSHILPLLIIIPLIGVILAYILETQILLNDLSVELESEAVQTAAMAAQQTKVWEDVAQAQIFVTQYGGYTRAEVRLLDKSGKLLASNQSADADNIGQPQQFVDLPTALSGQRVVRANYTLSLNTDIVEVLIPVVGEENNEVIGVVRLTQEIGHVQDRINNIRYAIGGVTVGAMILAVIVGLILALRLERPIRSVTEAIHNVAAGREWNTVPEQGPAELRLLVRAFNTLIERLRVLEGARQRLLANIVHEVGRPIGALQAAIQALLSGADQDPEMRRELLEGMHAEVNRLHPLLDNLTNLHGQILGTMELNCRPVKVSEWLPRTIGPWREAAQDKGLNWRADIPLNLPTINIDPDRMAQVLGNLLSNAVKYTPSQGSVSVAAGIEEEHIWIKVQDTGSGLTEEEIAHIFEPFYRSQPGRRFPQGMGLGLTIAQDLIVAHGGQLDVDSQPGQGTKFTIQLPLAP
jgi:signal transduction histidine kinase